MISNDIENEDMEEYTLGDEYTVNSSILEEVEWYIKVKNLLKSDRFVWLSSKAEKQNLASEIGYRAQKALYEILLKTNSTIRWDDFVMAVRSSRKLRKAVEAVIVHAVKHFDKSKLDFNLPEDALKYTDEDGEVKVNISSKIFDEETAEATITLLLMQAQVEYFNRLRESNPQYTWSIYRRELGSNGEMWLQFCRTFQYGFQQIDFTASWLCEDIPETKYLRHPDGCVPDEILP